MITQNRSHRIRNTHRVSFVVTNYSGDRISHTGWLIELIGNRFWRVWSDAHEKYLAVHETKLGWK